MEKRKKTAIFLIIIIGGALGLTFFFMTRPKPMDAAAILLILSQRSQRPCPTTMLNFTEEMSVDVRPGQGCVWTQPVYDGEHIVISYETNINISVRKYYLNLTPVGAPVEIINSTTIGNYSIADHKHLFQGGYHYLVFAASNQSLGNNGSLHLIKFDTDFNVLNTTLVVYNDEPVNDMLLVGDGTNVYVGKFFPKDEMAGAVHKIIKYDANLNWQANYSEGLGDPTHANGGATIYYGGLFYMVAPNRISTNPTTGENYNNLTYLMVYDLSWTQVQSPKVILNETGMLGLINGFSVYNHQFILHYSHGNYGENPIGRAVFDCNWNLLQNETVYNWGQGSNTTGCNAEHTVVVGNKLFLGYTNVTGTVPSHTGHLVKFDISIMT